MLTADLVRARVAKGEVKPRYIDPEQSTHQELAERLIELFAAHVGKPRRQLDDELATLLGTGTSFLLHRALAKLLFDRSSFDTAAAVAPEAVRAAVFNAAATAYGASAAGATATGAAASDETEAASVFHFDRQAVLAQVASSFDLSPEETERTLYADLRDEQVLSDWRPCSPAWLLDRYNVALAQGVLLRATELEIRLAGQSPQEIRALFRKIKFFQLLHRVEGRATEGYTIHLDGPLSLFRSSQRYGLQMASFLPTLLHFADWTLDAALLWGKRRLKRRFHLSPEDGLRPFGRLTGQWQPEEIRWFPDQFRKLASDWQVSSDVEPVDLGGQGILIPDFVFEHASGMRIYMEVLGFWRRGSVASRLALLRRQGPKHLIVALSKQLVAGQEGLDEIPGEVYVFRATPIARKVLARLEKIRTS